MDKFFKGCYKNSTEKLLTLSRGSSFSFNSPSQGMTFSTLGDLLGATLGSDFERDRLFREEDLLLLGECLSRLEMRHGEIEISFYEKELRLHY